MKVKRKLKNGEIKIYEYDHKKYYDYESSKLRRFKECNSKFTPEEGLLYYSSLYPDEQISYDPDNKVFISESGRYFSRSKKRGEINQPSVISRLLSPEEGIEYYSSLYPGEEIRYNEEYDVFVSDQGNVFSRSKKIGIFSKNYNNHGYEHFRRTTVHKLVMKTFGKYIEGLEIDHINNNPRDNRLCNLQMLSHIDNIRKRERAGSSKKVQCIELNKSYNSLTDAAKEFGLTTACLCIHLKGKSKTYGGCHWRYV